MKRSLLRTMMSIVFLAAGMISLPLQFVHAQSADDLLEQLGIEQLARDYVRPAVDAVGYGIKSGYVHSARVDSAFHVWIGVKGMATYIPAKDREFVGVLPEHLVAAGYPAEITTATIVGGNGAVLRSSNPEEPEIQLPDGTDLQHSYLVMPQLTIGPFLGTDIIIRGLPEVTFDPELGKVFFYGAAIQHEITHFFDFPVDISVLAGYQQFGLTDFIEGSSLNGMVVMGKEFGIVSLFGGVGYETYDIDVSYTPESATLPDEAITLHFKRRNLRLTLGGAVQLLPFLEITGEYSFGEMNNLTLGAGLSL